MKIVGVTACIAGVAHTYMAKANLEKFAKKHDVDILVETQGAMGVEDRLEQEDIDSADIVIFAVDTNVSDVDRFDGKTIINKDTHDVVKYGESVILEAIKLYEENGEK